MTDQDEGVRVFVHAALAAMKGIGTLTESATGACPDCEQAAATSGRTVSATASVLYRVGTRDFCAVCATNRAKVAKKIREAA